MRPGRRRARAWVATTLLLVALAAPSPGRAQHPGMPDEPTLHERLDAASRVAWVVVEGAKPGRLELRLRRALHGTLPDRFELKRAPSNPPPLATGSHAILLMRGERSPFVLSGRPDRVLEVGGDAAEMLAEAVAETLAARSDPAALARLYGGWIPSEDERLRHFGRIGLERLAEGTESLRREIAVSQAALATDAGARIESRRTAAMLALRHLDGASILVDGLAAEAPSLDDPSLFRLGLQAGTSVGTPSVERLYDAAVAHEDPQVRRVAMRLARAVASVVGDRALAAAERLAADDPVSAVRRQAERAIRPAAARRDG